VVSQVIFPAIALNLVQEITSAVEVGISQVEADKSVTNVVKSDTLLAIARKVVVIAAAKAVVAAMEDDNRLVTLVEGMATWHATAPRVRNATTAAK